MALLYLHVVSFIFTTTETFKCSCIHPPLHFRATAHKFFCFFCHNHKGVWAALRSPWTLSISGGVFVDDAERYWIISRWARWQWAAHQRLKAFAEAAGEQVVYDRVNGGAEVEEHARDYVHVLEYVMHVVRPTRDEAPQQSVDVERSPADGKD